MLSTSSTARKKTSTPSSRASATKIWVKERQLAARA
jgi:hypothetical protein